MDSEQYLEALLALPEIYHPIVSRDGAHVAWTWFRLGPAADVFVAPTDGSAPPLRLSRTPENTYLVSWSADGSAVIVAEDHGGDERARLFRIAIDDPEVMHPLTEDHPDFFLRGGELHPNNELLIYGANYDFAAGREIEPTWVYRHNLRTGERLPLARPAKPAYCVPALSHDGLYILYPRKDLHPSGRQIWLVDIEGKDDREILNLGADVKVFADWFPNEHRLLVLAEAGTHRRLGTMSVPGGEVQWLVGDPERNIEDAFVPFGSREIVMVEVRGGRETASLLNPASGRERPVTPPRGAVIPLAPCSGQEWVGMVYGSTQPTDLCRFAMEGSRASIVASLSRIWEHTPLTAKDFTPAEDYRWVSTDGLPIHGFLYRPASPSRGTIVYVHGGPTEHASDAIDSEIQVFAHSGFTVLAPNFRGSTGYGLAFQEAIKRDGWGGMEQEDIRTGIEQLIADGLASPGKVGMTGTSFGGYATWWASTHLPTDLVAAAAPVCGMTDLVVDYESTRPDLRPLSEEMMGGSPSDIPEKYAERSPIHFVSGISAALLIVQGGRDPNVTPENVRVVRQALDRAGIAYEVLRFEDEGHGILKPENEKRLYLALLEFFRRALA